MIAGLAPGWLRARAAISVLQAALAAPREARARILDVTPEQYLADPCRTPSLNATTALAIVSESPAHGWQQHPRLGGSPHGGAGTKAMNDGTLIHSLLLRKGKELAIIDAPDFRTNAARDARDAAIAEGRVPVLQHVYAQRAAVAEKLREKCAELGYVFDQQTELAIEFEDGGVLARAMLDHVDVESGRIVDVKKVECANPRKIERTFRDYGYDLQYIVHTRALAALRPELEGRVRFTFLFLEIEPPFSVVPIEPNGAWREIGALRWEKARRLWSECLASGRWPGYFTGGPPIVIEPPSWVLAEELGTWQQ